MALFVSRGFAAWRQAWIQAAPIQEEGKECPSRAAYPQPAVRLAGEIEAQVVSALAGMVLDALRGEAA